MNDNSKFKLGLFIIFATVVFFAGLFILGTMDRFKEKAYLSTLVSESVQGLSVGSSVKYQGVPIGSVREIMIYPNDNVIRIDMEINISKFKIQQPGHSPVTISVEEFNANIEKAVRNGLRCRMELEGITGSKYIELQNDKEAAPSRFDVDEFGLEYTYVPSQPSLISDLRGSVTTILAKLESIDYKGLSDRTNAVLDSINERVNSPKFDETIDNVNAMINEARKSIENLEKLTGSDVRDKIDTISQNVNLAVNAVESLTKSVEVEIKAIEFGKIAENFRSFLSTAIRTSKTLDETLFNVDNGIDAVIELIQYIDSDPAALIQGKKKPKSDAPAQGASEKKR
jgi:phospholipid/cholesterol/gamma-HCH transport system substrate-binding protein/paraquat-inducible protein B